MNLRVRHAHLGKGERKASNSVQYRITAGKIGLSVANIKSPGLHGRSRDVCAGGAAVETKVHRPPPQRPLVGQFDALVP